MPRNAADAELTMCCASRRPLAPLAAAAAAVACLSAVPTDKAWFFPAGAGAEGLVQAEDGWDCPRRPLRGEDGRNGVVLDAGHV